MRCGGECVNSFIVRLQRVRPTLQPILIASTNDFLPNTFTDGISSIARVSWIRHPNHEFFVIDKEIQNPDFVVEEFRHDRERRFLETVKGAE